MHTFPRCWNVTLQTLGFKRKRRIRKASMLANSRSLFIETLESRRALTAVGFFERFGGEVEAKAVASADAGASDFDGTNGSIEEMLAHATAHAEDSSASGSAEADSQSVANIPTPIGGHVAAPQANAASTSNLKTEGFAAALTYYNSFGVADGFFEYHADPEVLGDLEFHGHLFIAGYGQTDSPAPLYIDPTGATIGDYSIGAINYGGDVWHVTGSLPSGTFYYTSEGGFNLHVHFTISASNGFSVRFTSEAVSASRIATGGEGQSSQLTWNSVAASWGYVTEVGQDLTPGDFNADGVVDEGDFGIWEEGQPQADADEDGDIDDDDLEIWAANTDVLLVSTESDVSDGIHGFGNLSLREAIGLAATNAGPDKIVISPSVENILLTGGALSIGSTNAIEIIGHGADSLTIDANNASNLFSITGAGSTVIQSTISGMTLTGGNSYAISHSDSTGKHNLLLDDVAIIDNQGGISSNGRVTVSNSTVAENFNAGIKYDGSYSVGPLTVSNSTVRDNGSHGIQIAIAHHFRTAAGAG